MSINGPISWFWDFGDGSTSAVQHPQHLYINDGYYTVSLITSNVIGSDTLEKPLYVVVDKPEDPIVDSAWRCDPGSVTLIGTGSENMQWFDAPLGGNLVFTGDTFVTPYLDSTTVFYVQDFSPAPSQHIGPVDNTIGGGSYYIYSSYRYLIFDCFSSITLASVLVYTDSAGIRTIELNDASGTLLQDTAVYIPVGESRLYLNFEISAGTDYQLATAGGSRLWRNSNGGVFPYDLPGLVSITGTNSSSTSTYYYFYDWEVSGGQCESNRIPSLAEIYLPPPVITPSGTIEICDGQSVTLTSQPADSYLWWPGNETTQSISVDVAGSYVVQVTDSICTSTSDTVTVEVVNNPPTAGFTYVSNFLEVTFTNTSTNSDSYFWDFGDSSTSIQTDPAHTYDSAGTYSVMLITENICGTDTFITTITVTGSGISENSDNSIIIIYPNPSDGHLYIDVSNLIVNINVNYSVYDMIGKVINSGTFSPINNKIHAVVHLEGTSKGVYFIRFYNESINNTCKIIIK